MDATKKRPAPAATGNGPNASEAEPSHPTPPPAGTQLLLTRREAAQRLNLKPGTLASWSSQGRGPAFVRLGRAVRYRLDDLQNFVDAGAVRPGG